MEPIKIGLIGTGHSHAAGKLAALRANADFEVVGVAEPDQKLAAAAQGAAAYQGLPFVAEEQLLNTPGLTAVAVETNVPDLLAAGERVIEAGKHLHLEKPGGASLPRFRRLLDMAARKHLVVQLGYMYRYSPAILLMRDLVKQGALGEPFEIHAVMSKVVNPPSRRAFAEFAGGMMFEQGCHLIDLVIGLMGRPARVTSFLQHVAPIDDRLADNTLAVLEYPRAIASVKSSAMEVEGGARRHFVVCGTEGTCHVQPLDEPNVQLALSRPRGDYKKGYQEIRFGEYPRYVGDMADLAKLIRGEKEPDFSYDHDITVLETMLTASKMPLDR
ncbi:MAG TPA: Gfo/Idh/MocA family oxidoreductase [Pirellulales bacterium]|nr:Gfo/Idh/MocA family oxidoreductase [Pirellulales bacterium]